MGFKRCQRRRELSSKSAMAATFPSTRCVVGPQAHRQDTASVGVPIDGDPIVSGAANGIGRTGLVSRVVTRWGDDNTLPVH